MSKSQRSLRLGIVSLSVAVLLAVVAGTAQTGKPSVPVPKYKVGDVAPDFTLKDQNGKNVSLHDFRGKNVVLAFYVFAFSGG